MASEAEDRSRSAARWRPVEEAGRVLAVVAHPDDLEMLVGGTVCKLVGGGATVVEVVCTDGELGTHDTARFSRASLGETRRGEARAAAKALGIGEIVFLGYPDGELEATLELRAALARQYRIHQPELLLTFHPCRERHPDHRAAGRAALDAVIPASMPLYRPDQLRGGLAPSRLRRACLFSAVLADDEPSIYVDVTDVWERRMAAAREHHSQWTDGERIRAWLEALGRDQGEAAGVRYAERLWPALGPRGETRR